jgi:hypothetical protein
MSIICQYCKKSFQNNGSLKNHQRRAKYCLKLQKNDDKTFKEIKDSEEDNEDDNEEDFIYEEIKVVKKEENKEIKKQKEKKEKKEEDSETSETSIETEEKQKIKNFQITDIILNKHSEFLENKYNKIFDKIEKFEEYIRNNIDKNNYIVLLEKNNQEKTNLIKDKEQEIIKLKEIIEKEKVKKEKKKVCKKEIEILENNKYKIKNDQEFLFKYIENDYIDSTDLCLILGNDYLKWRKNKLSLLNIKMIAEMNNLDENLLIINTNNKILIKYQILFLLCELYSNELKFNIEKWVYDLNRVSKDENNNDSKEENKESNYINLKVNIKKTIKTGFFAKK